MLAALLTAATVAAAAAAPAAAPERRSAEEIWQGLTGRPGIIGPVDFVAVPRPSDPDFALLPAETAQLVSHIGVLMVAEPGDPDHPVDPGEQLVDIGIATIVTEEDGSYGLLTARHLVYDLDTGERLGARGYFIHPASGIRTPVDLSVLPDFVAPARPLPRRNDQVFVPLSGNGEEGALSEYAVGWAQFGLDHAPDYRGRQERNPFAGLTPMSVSMVNAGGVYTYLVQSGFRLSRNRQQPWPLAVSDVDTLPSMSGSPIFVKGPHGPVLIGIQVATTRMPDCAEYDPSRYCYNLVLVVE